MTSASKMNKKERKQKLISLLKTKVVQRYGTDAGPTDRYNMYLTEIIDSVTGLVMGDITKAHLTEIEGRAKKAYAGYLKHNPMGLSANKRKEAKSKPKFVTPASLKNDWVIMDFFEAIENDKSIKADAQKLHDTKIAVRRTLDEQVARKQEIQRKERVEEERYLKEQNSIMEQWNYEQQVSKWGGGCVGGVVETSYNNNYIY